MVAALFALTATVVVLAVLLAVVLRGAAAERARFLTELRHAQNLVASRTVGEVVAVERAQRAEAKPSKDRSEQPAEPRRPGR